MEMEKGKNDGMLRGSEDNRNSAVSGAGNSSSSVEVCSRVPGTSARLRLSVGLRCVGALTASVLPRVGLAVR